MLQCSTSSLCKKGISVAHMYNVYRRILDQSMNEFNEIQMIFNTFTGPVTPII